MAASESSSEWTIRTILIAAISLALAYTNFILFRPVLPAILAALYLFAALEPLKRRLASMLVDLNPIYDVSVVTACVATVAMAQPYFSIVQMGIVSLGSVAFYFLFRKYASGLLAALIILGLGAATAAMLILLCGWILWEEFNFIRDNQQAIVSITAESVLSKLPAWIEPTANDLGFGNASLPIKKMFETIDEKGFTSYLVSVREDTARNIGGASGSLSLIGLCLLYMLQYSDSLLEWLKALSPFCADDQRFIAESVRDAARTLMMGELVIFFAHGASTAALLLASKSPLAVSIGILDGIIAVLPLVPANVALGATCVGLIALGSAKMALVLMAKRGLLLFFFNPMVFGWIPGWHYHSTALSASLGFKLFGLEGIVLGPAIVCTTRTLLETYRRQKTREKRALVS